MRFAETVDVSRLIDERPIDGFNYRLLALSLLIFLFDGYDITVLFVAMPQIKSAWQVTNPVEIGTVLSANLLGIFLGSPLFGYIGDHFGRKKAMILSCLTFGVFTLMAVGAQSMTQMGILRLLAGTGIGGLLPTVAFSLVVYTGDILYGLWYPVLVCVMSLVVSLLFLKETYKVDIHQH
jgi:AAHS family 4-hydroxybenzoate transporter-like MFS transporter